MNFPTLPLPFRPPPPPRPRKSNTSQSVILGKSVGGERGWMEGEERERRGVTAGSLTHQCLDFSQRCGFSGRNIACKAEAVAGFPVACPEPLGF